MNRLILIGNGFDIAHGMKTAYTDFINNYWLQEIEKIKTKKRDSQFYENNQFKLFSQPPTVFSGKTFQSLDEELGQYSKGVVFTNHFFGLITRKNSVEKWVDVEDEFYKLLKAIFNGQTPFGKGYDIIKLNEELIEIQNLLCIYLKEAEDNYDFRNSPRKTYRVSEIIYHDFKPRDFTEVGLEDLARIYKTYLTSTPPSVHSNMDKVEDQKRFELLKQITNGDFSKSEILKLLRSKTPENYLKIEPEHLLLLNFNYTDTSWNYSIPRNASIKLNSKVISIHGSISTYHNNPIIFGYGDELDDDYKNIEKLNDNNYLKNIKSIRYSQTANYKRLLEFLDSDLFQVLIFGHSCGISDRTMLNTVFEHDNCVSVKPYYHQINDKEDNYDDLAINISRNFNDKKKLRDRLVNKTYCEPLT